MEFVEITASAGLALVTYSLVDKVLAPLIKAKLSGKDDVPAAAVRPASGPTVVGMDVLRRLEAVEADLREIQRQLPEMRTDTQAAIGQVRLDIAVASELLKRMEGRMTP